MATHDQSDPTPTVVVTIDGLRAAALGAYGQTAWRTPAFDALAADGTVYDWCYAPTPDPRDLLRGGPGRATNAWRLVTDDASIADAAREAVRSVQTFDAPAPAALAESTDSASQAAVWLRFAEAIVEHPPSADGVLWLHTRGLYGPWDAPADLLDGLLDEDDPPFDLTAAAPSGELDADDLDARFAAGCRYAMQVRLLDACFGEWMPVAEAVMEGERWRLVLAGAGGFALGEHGRLGRDARLFSESQHVPLLVRDGAPQGRFARVARPMRLDEAFAAAHHGAAPAGGELRMASPTGAAVVLDGGWLLRRPGADEARDTPELYVKPDDRWEQNDVASLERDRVDRLTAELATRESGVAADRHGA